MKFDYFIGVDVSKGTLDFCIVHEGKQLKHSRIQNDSKAIKRHLKVIKKEFQIEKNNLMVCMENTGVYSNHLLVVLHELSIAAWVESAVHIKQSMGVQRGKNDKVDAHRIALFAYKNRDEIKLWEAQRTEIIMLKQMIRMRKRIINTISNLKKSIGEHAFMTELEKKFLYSSISGSLIALQKDLISINAEIKDQIKKDEELSRLFRLSTSVKGIGSVTATQIIVATNEFKSITEAKKFACYAGVAPFEHSSGSSIRGRSHVSNMADKTIKCSLHMAALAAVRECGELQDYYIRKIEEGKNKMAVLNAVRNKLVHRIFACVKNNRMYEKNYGF